MIDNRRPGRTIRMDMARHVAYTSMPPGATVGIRFVDGSDMDLTEHFEMLVALGASSQPPETDGEAGQKMLVGELFADGMGDEPIVLVDLEARTSRAVPLDEALGLAADGVVALLKRGIDEGSGIA